MIIPDNWTFQSEEIASNFDSHVREQLPWYDLVTEMIQTIAGHYITKKGIVYDIGASTGNIGKSLSSNLEKNNAIFTAIEESQEMARKYSGPGKIVNEDALKFTYEPFDLAVLFLVVMFLPYNERDKYLARLYMLMKPGGAMIIVDKTNIPAGYVGTAFRRLTMALKLKSGASGDDIIKKELSLAGYQRPIDIDCLPGHPVEFFRAGEFAGWVIEKPKTSHLRA